MHAGYHLAVRQLTGLLNVKVTAIMICQWSDQSSHRHNNILLDGHNGFQGWLLMALFCHDMTIMSCSWWVHQPHDIAAQSHTVKQAVSRQLMTHRPHDNDVRSMIVAQSVFWRLMTNTTAVSWFIHFISFSKHARQAQPTQSGMHWSNQLSPTSSLMC